MTTVVLLTVALMLVALHRTSSRRTRAIFARSRPDCVETEPVLSEVSPSAIAEVADVLALCLTMGADLLSALHALSGTSPLAIRPHLRRTAALLDVQAPIAEAWRHWGPAALPLVQAFERSARTGAPVADECRRVAAALRDDQLASVQRQARGVGVRAVLPLMTCFLPAFVLVGVVPVIASLIGGLLAST